MSGFACGEDAEDGVFQFRMNNITADGQLDFTRQRRVPLGTKSIDRYLIANGDVLFNATNSPELVGKSAYFPGFSEPAVFSNHFLRLRPIPDRLNGQYLARWLHLQFQIGRFKSMCRQWVNQATVNRESLLAMCLPLPPIEEQKRIAAILDAADALRVKRRESIVLLDALLQSIFLDMFGDPVTNPMGWEKVKLGESGEVITGNTPSRSNPKYYGDFIEWIKSDNINTPSCFLTKAQEGLSELGKKVARVAPAGSILITCIAGSPACIGNAAIVDRVVAFNQQINAFMPGSDVELWYMFMLLVVGKSLIQSSSTKSMKGMVSKSALSSVSIPLPPLSLQRRFSSIVEAAERQKARLRAHLDELDALFSSLQSRAFNGEL